MKILYLHGMASSKEAHTANVLREHLFEDTILAIDIPSEPYEALKVIFKTICEFHPNIIIGTSLGGFYAMFFEGPWKILINPALRPDEELIGILNSYGEHPYLKDREDGSKTFNFTKRDEESFRILRNNFESKIKDFDHVSQTYALFGYQDNIVNDREYFNKLFNSKHALTFMGGHRLNDENIIHILIPLIDELREF